MNEIKSIGSVCGCNESLEFIIINSPFESEWLTLALSSVFTVTCVKCYNIKVYKYKHFCLSLLVVLSRPLNEWINLLQTDISLCLCSLTPFVWMLPWCRLAFPPPEWFTGGMNNSFWLHLVDWVFLFHLPTQLNCWDVRCTTALPVKLLYSKSTEDHRRR